MPIKVKERFLVYPLMFMVIFYVLYTKFEGSMVTEYLNGFVSVYYEAIVKDFNLMMNELTFVVLLAYLVGYIYGSFSLVIKIREMKGLLQIVLGVVKLLASIFLVAYGAFFLLGELVLLPFSFLIAKKFKARKKQQSNKEMLALMRQAIREEQKNALTV